MIAKDIVQSVFDLVASEDALGVGCQTGVDGLFAFADPEVSACKAGFYEPVMCLVLQGTKEAQIGGRVLRYSAGDTLLVSHAVHVESAVIQASAQAPYVALALKLDLALARSLYDEIGGIGAPAKDLHSMRVEKGDAALVDAVMRLYQLSQDPLEARALAPLVMKEIHFRLLRARHGCMLRQLLRHESAASRISKTIAYIRANYTSQIPVADLAAESGMSLSAFHEHFKAVTSTTPLQYQKELRLMEARRLLAAGQRSVAAAAYDVGYESPTQFSREYSRKFGVSPSDHKATGTLLAI
ncbi:AraC family transcriptional regulator [Shimia marina]|uniref:L-rhamnose operon regulatory protein RhaS n=1 Tax=Shimia marina TaxID=321267 RepID=A0A0P1EJU9_9RHOB|nr:AraC family transcriptional regulator [Shimia marina]CUH50781.1 L-rhamnose operon regulatory protein RhaS [Shimia marina]SFE65793.1 transcriptional regulator, AraC family [Shimia marina]